MIEMLNVLAAAAASFAFGAFWYTSMSKAWIAASGISVGSDGRPEGGSSPMPFVIGIIAMIFVAGMMRHIFAMSGIDSLGKGIVAGAGLGAFVVVPWLAMNYAFSMRKPSLTLIDGVNVIAGSAIMGFVLTLF